MTNSTKIDNSVDYESSSRDRQLTQACAPMRAVYVRPELICYGDVRDVTLGPTVGFGESGGGPFCAEGVNCP